MTNLLAYIAQFTLFFTFGSALAIGTNLSRNQNPLIFGIALVVTNLVVFAFAVFTALRRYLIQKKKDFLRLERQAQNLELAVSITAEQWAINFEDICRNTVSRSHCLVIWYSSLEGARDALRNGIPARESGGLAMSQAGILFTLQSPRDVEPNVMSLFPRREAVLACSVQKNLLYRIKG